MSDIEIVHQGLAGFRVSTRLCGCFGMEVYCAADATAAVDDEAKNVERKDRRRYPRVKANVSVELRTTENAPPSRVSIVEISLCGCYIETMFTMAVGEKAFLVLWLNDQSIRTTAVVATRHPQVGNGFEFIDMSPEDRLSLSEFIHELSSETHNHR
jgi:c-di-GMP-binding flagellar brake protein YcgR